VRGDGFRAAAFFTGRFVDACLADFIAAFFLVVFFLVVFFFATRLTAARIWALGTLPRLGSRRITRFATMVTLHERNVGLQSGSDKDDARRGLTTKE
jgi:hypothetical protein